MGSVLLSTPIIAPTNLDRHQILRNFCHESVRKGLRERLKKGLTGMATLAWEDRGPKRLDRVLQAGLVRAAAARIVLTSIGRATP